MPSSVSKYFSTLSHLHFLVLFQITLSFIQLIWSHLLTVQHSSWIVQSIGAPYKNGAHISECRLLTHSTNMACNALQNQVFSVSSLPHCQKPFLPDKFSFSPSNGHVSHNSAFNWPEIFFLTLIGWKMSTHQLTQGTVTVPLGTSKPDRFTHVTSIPTIQLTLHSSHHFELQLSVHVLNYRDWPIL